MELYQEILAHYLGREIAEKILPALKLNAKCIIESECYSALNRIKEIICDDDLSDCECFEKIEKIVCVFENLGSNGGNRHDF